MKIKNEVAGSEDADAVGVGIQLVSDSPESIYDSLGVATTLPSQTAPDPTDTNPTDPTTPEVDTDGDGIIDSSDPDIDGDGVLNADDADHPDNVSELDTDGDGIIDSSDPDIDGDGVLNADDADPTDPNMSASTTPAEYEPYVSAWAANPESEERPYVLEVSHSMGLDEDDEQIVLQDYVVIDTRAGSSSDEYKADNAAATLLSSWLSVSSWEDLGGQGPIPASMVFQKTGSIITMSREIYNESAFDRNLAIFRKGDTGGASITVKDQFGFFLDRRTGLVPPQVGEPELSAPVDANSYTIPDYDSSYGINVSMAGNASTIAWSRTAENGGGGYGAGRIYYANNSGSSWGSKQTIPNSSYVAGEEQGYTTQLSYDGLVLASAGKCQRDSTNRVYIRINRRSTNSESFALSETITKDFSYNAASNRGNPRFKLSGDGNTIVLYMYGRIGSASNNAPDAGIWIYKWNGDSWVEKNFDSSYTLQNRRDERELKIPVQWGDSGSSVVFDIDPILMTDVSHNGDMIYSLVVDPAVTTGPRRFHLKGYKYDSGLDEYDSTWMSYTTDHATSISCGKSGSSIAWSLYGEAKARHGEVGNDGTLTSFTIVDFVPTIGDVNSWDENASGTEIHSCVTMEETANPDGDDLGVSVALSWRVNSLSWTQFYSATNVFEYSDSDIWVEKATLEGGYDQALPFVQLSNDAKSLLYYRGTGPYNGHVGKVLKRTALPYGWA